MQLLPVDPCSTPPSTCPSLSASIPMLLLLVEQDSLSRLTTRLMKDCPRTITPTPPSHPRATLRQRDVPRRLRSRTFRKRRLNTMLIIVRPPTLDPMTADTADSLSSSSGATMRRMTKRTLLAAILAGTTEDTPLPRAWVVECTSMAEYNTDHQLRHRALPVRPSGADQPSCGQRSGFPSGSGIRQD